MVFVRVVNNWVMEDFIVRALLVAIGIAIIAGSLGCLVIWKRMSYFSESVAHSALLGVALGLVSGLGIQLGLLLTSVVFALLLLTLQMRKLLSSDAILGILSHITLALGVLALAQVGDGRTDYFALLFGDILSVSNQDIIWVSVVLLVIISFLVVSWQRLLLLIVNQDLARAEGIKQPLYEFLFMLMVALSVSVSVQIVGVLLITSLLIIPPAIARIFAKTPLQMVFQSVFISMVAVMIGLGSSVSYDLATGPMIVVSLGGLFALSQLFAAKWV